MNFPEKPFDFAAGELLLVDKPISWTSFDVVGKIRNTIRPLKIKVGHAGTLDPLATGLLIICTGKMTKSIDQFQAEDKEYTGTITLGATTPTFDLESEIDKTYDISQISEQEILEVAASFLGDQDQIPPAHSAIKINGERVYEKARRGEEIELKPRKVRIERFDIENIVLPNIYFRVKCTKGTYIRSLANDFGKRLNNGSHLSSLCRTRSGDFQLKDAWELPKLLESIKLQKQLNLPNFAE